MALASMYELFVALKFFKFLGSDFILLIMSLVSSFPFVVLSKEDYIILSIFEIASFLYLISSLCMYGKISLLLYFVI